MQAATLNTLKNGPDNKGPVFNKIRMTVFPKWYVHGQRQESADRWPFMAIDY
jgi:hypothetical protein